MHVDMRAIVVGSLSLVVAILAPASLAAAQTPPVVVIGGAPSTSTPPPQTAPTVPPGYEVEGELGGMHFYGRLYAPPATPTPAPTPAPAPVAPAPVAPAPAPAMVVTAPPPSYPTYRAYPTYQPTYAAPAPTYSTYSVPQQRDRAPRLDDGVGFGGRLALDVLGAGVGGGLAIGLGYLVSQGNLHEDTFSITTIGAMAGLVPAGISIFGGAMGGGRGRYWGALFGELIGGGLAATVVAGANISFDNPWMLLAAIGGPAILGALIGFEAQHGLRTARLERRMQRQEGLALEGVSIAPIASNGATGAMLGVSGSF
jgi:hypothetical protein